MNLCSKSRIGFRCEADSEENSKADIRVESYIQRIEDGGDDEVVILFERQIQEPLKIASAWNYPGGTLQSGK